MSRYIWRGACPGGNHSLLKRIASIIMTRSTITFIGLIGLAGYILGIPSSLLVNREIDKVTSDLYRSSENDVRANSVVESNNKYDDRGCSSSIPEEEMTTIDMIKHMGYPAEEHFVTTEDGYILALHRIPGKVGSPTVLMHHALLESSFCWVITGKGRGLAFILADAGYDVWMGNVRGNTYSRNHTTLSPESREFWNFSWHEMGIYDVPAEINYITSIKKDSLMYIGHSMGTTVYYVMSSERPDIASKVKAMFAFAPVAFTGHVKGPFWIFGSSVQLVQKRMSIDGHSEFFAQNAAFRFAAKHICSLPVLQQICRGVIFSTVGYNIEKFETSMLPVILTHTPAGTSFKTLLHFAQGIESKKFRKYDYGEKINTRIYKSKTPPEYDFSKIPTPVAVFWSQNDYLADPKDVMRLYEKIPNIVAMYEVSDPNFNHLDFLWGIDAPNLVYSKLLSLMENYRYANEVTTE